MVAEHMPALHVRYAVRERDHYRLYIADQRPERKIDLNPEWPYAIRY